MSGCLIQSNDSLWVDAAKHIPNASDVRAFWNVASSEAFINDHREELDIITEAGREFPTFASARKVLLKLNFQGLAFLKGTPEIAKQLQDRANQGVTGSATAVTQAVNFNKNNSFSDSYVAVPMYNEQTKKFEVQILDNTQGNQELLVQKIQEFATKERISNALIKAGVQIQYVDGVVNSSDGIEFVVDAITGITKIKISISEEGSMSEKEARAAARYIIHNMSSEPLVARLIEYTQSNNEDAESMLQTAILGKSEGKIPLLKRIKLAVKRIFKNDKNLKPEDLKLVSLRNARKVAKGLLDFSLLDKYDRDQNSNSIQSKDPNRELIHKVTKNLEVLATQLREIDKYYYNKIMAVVKDLQNQDVSTNGLNPELTSSVYLASLGYACKQMQEIVHDITNHVSDVNMLDASEFNNKTIEYAKSLRGAHEVCRSLSNIVLLIRNATVKLVDPNNINQRGNQHNYSITAIGDIEDVQLGRIGMQGVSVNLDQALNDIVKYVHTSEGSLFQSVIAKEREFSLLFLKSIAGDNYVEKASRIMFGKHMKNFIGIAEMNASIEDNLLTLEHDNSWAEMWLTSMSNNPDLIGAIVDKAIKQANTVADNLTIELQDELRIIREKCKDIGIDPIKFYELDEQGDFTGNFLTEYDWGRYERDYNEAMAIWKQDFLTASPDSINWPDIIRGVKFQEYIKPLLKEWHKKHSRWDSEKEMFFPVTRSKPASYTKNGTVITVVSDYDYTSPQYKKLENENPTAKVLLEKLIKIKQELDNKYLPVGATKYYRLPQFRGTFTQRLKNNGISMSLDAGPIKALRSKTAELFTVDSDDYQFGNCHHYNTLEEDMFRDKVDHDRNKVDRLAMYGINKLQDPKDITRDLFHGMLAYGAMAHSYNALTTVAQAAEVVGNQLERRETKEDGVAVLEEARTEHTRAFKRYSKYLTQHLYGVGQKQINWLGVSWNKIGFMCSKLASFAWLAGNVHSGIVNLGTGSIEVFKEALVGQFFNAEDWVWAHKYYYGSIGSNLAQVGLQDKDDKISLFIQLFNARGNNDTDFKHWRDRGRIAELFWRRSLYMPYTLGEHYMQTIAFLAMAHNQKVFIKEGDVIKEIPLFEAYTTMYLKTGSKDSALNKVLNKGPKKLVLKGNTFKSKQGAEDYSRLSKLLEFLEYSVTNNMAISESDLSEENKQLLQRYNLPINLRRIISIKNTISQIQEIQKNLLWDSRDVGTFKLKAREVCNRMHGVYNTEDKILLQMNILGAMFTSMKGYAIGLAQRRFLRSHYNFALGGWSEGSEITAAKVAWIGLTNLFGANPYRVKDAETGQYWSRFKVIKNSLLGYCLPVNTKSLKAMGFQEDQVRNLRRHHFDWMAVLTLLFGTLALAAGDDDDEEDDNYVSALAHYFITRWYYEQAAFTPIGIKNEVEQFTKGWEAVPGLTVLGDYIELANLGLGYAEHEYKYEPYREGMSDLEYQELSVPYRKDSDYYYQRDGDFYEKGDPKVWLKLQKMLPYWKSWFIFSNPRQATSSFNFYRSGGKEAKNQNNKN